jgi:hypothetical protein
MAAQAGDGTALFFELDILVLKELQVSLEGLPAIGQAIYEKLARALVYVVGKKLGRRRGFVKRIILGQGVENSLEQEIPFLGPETLSYEEPCVQQRGA